MLQCYSDADLERLRAYDANLPFLKPICLRDGRIGSTGPTAAL